MHPQHAKELPIVRSGRWMFGSNRPRYGGGGGFRRFGGGGMEATRDLEDRVTPEGKEEAGEDTRLFLVYLYPAMPSFHFFS